MEAQTDAAEAVALLLGLVANRTLSGEELAVQERVSAWLRAHGLSVGIEDVESGRPNVTTVLQNGEGPTLLINGHVNTASIDPRWDPSRVLGIREGDRFFGLGAADMKAGVVAGMLATRALDRTRKALTTSSTAVSEPTTALSQNRAGITPVSVHSAKS